MQTTTAIRLTPKGQARLTDLDLGGSGTNSVRWCLAVSKIAMEALWTTPETEPRLRLDALNAFAKQAFPGARDISPATLEYCVANSFIEFVEIYPHVDPDKCLKAIDDLEHLITFAEELINTLKHLRGYPHPDDNGALMDLVKEQRDYVEGFKLPDLFKD